MNGVQKNAKEGLAQGSLTVAAVSRSLPWMAWGSQDVFRLVKRSRPAWPLRTSAALRRAHDVNVRSIGYRRKSNAERLWWAFARTITRSAVVFPFTSA